MGLVITGQVLAYDFFYWDRGATGHESALYGAELSEKPLILYFHVQGCGWCEELNNTYLATEKLESFLLEMYKVEIDPDRGEDEKALHHNMELRDSPPFSSLYPLLRSSL